MKYKVAALYKFTPVEDIPTLRQDIYEFGESCEGLCGTLLLAPEGINGTIAATPEALDRMIDFLDQKLSIRQGELKFSQSAITPFNRFKVRPKKELITLRKPEADPNKIVGEYVEAEDWNDLINNPDVQQAVENGTLAIHGWVFDIATGKIIDLELDLNQLTNSIKQVYKVVES